MTQAPTTYKASGVDYDAMDPFKRAAQRAGCETAGNVSGKYREVGSSRGESAYLIEGPDCYLAQVEEGLGTKNLVADDMYTLTKRSFYDHIAQDTVAMIVNDVITLGALPLSIAMHLAVGDSDWFKDEQRSSDLVNGWRNACHLSRCTWGGGETPTLKDVVVPHAVVLSGSAMGIIEPKERILSVERIRPDDAIMIATSSGIHANGLTLARKIAGKLPDGYLTPMDDGRSFGEALLDPTHIYVGLIADCLDRGVDVHYAVNVTGHGWRKLMRAPQSFAYVIDTLPAVHPVFRFIQRHGPVEEREMYANFNMGAGFVLYVPKADVSKVGDLCRENTYDFKVYSAGHVDSCSEKQVVIREKNIVFSGATLGVR